MKHSKTKLFSYWCARFTPEPYGKTMQQLLKAAFDNTTVQDRLVPTSADENYFHFINYKTIRNGYFCAEFFGYEKGRIGQVIKEAFNQEQVDPKALPAPQADDGTDQQYLDGKLYFICKDDHFILVQDMHTKGRQLERYLEEIIRKRCATHPEDQQFVLERSISQKARKKIKGVKKIHLSAPLEYKREADSTAKSEFMNIPIGKGWEALRGFLGEKLDLSRFSLKGITDPKEIEITISLAWKKKRGDTVSDQIDTLANTFRHVDDELDFEVETLSGKMKKDELRLSHPFSVQHIDDMPDRGDIFDKMISWYEHLVEAKDI